MNERTLALLAVLLLLVFVLVWVSPWREEDPIRRGGGVHLPTRAPTVTATPGWWQALPTPIPWEHTPTPTATE